MFISIEKKLHIQWPFLLFVSISDDYKSNNMLKKKEKKKTEKQKSLSIRIYILGGSSFSGERSCAHIILQEVVSQTPG